MSNFNEELFLSLYEKGKMDTEIAKVFNVSSSTVANWRKKRDLPTKFSYDKISKVDKDKVKELFALGYSDYKIAEILNMSPDGIYSHRMRYGLIRKEKLIYNNPIPLTDTQIEVLVGTVLGDSTLRCTNANAYLVCSHSPKQRIYCETKHKIFESLGSSFRYSMRKTPDKRTGKCYESYVFKTASNPELNKFYQSFYPNGTKVIPRDLVEKYFTEQSLAYLFMDDGYICATGYCISTMCFTEDDVQWFSRFLLRRFGIHSNIHKGKIIYITTKSAKLFVKIILPYITEDTMYKLRNHVNLGKP